MPAPAYLDTSKLIVGASGSGKTVTAKDEVAQLLAGDRHVVVIDPTGVWWGNRAIAALKAAELVRDDRRRLSIAPELLS